jgi:hypothetical protein
MLVLGVLLMVLANQGAMASVSSDQDHSEMIELVITTKLILCAPDHRIDIWMEWDGFGCLFIGIIRRPEGRSGRRCRDEKDADAAVAILSTD